ncbi:hypothetical protein Daus18300_009314 [Diaporthe australafricana]|uniref:NAD dependent epimerase/dehydratase n=1 Tax=Diaporthe australafricana TaxID=127596 RepID=A0ABR3WEG6_9PEZI
MKVLVLGLPRTGTQSLADALAQLGISNVYHMREVGKNKHQDLWVQALEDNLEGKGPAWGRQDFEKILAGFEGVADFPAAMFPEQLVHAYPEAAIILSTRAEDGWYASMMSTLVHHHANMPADSTSPMAPLATKYHTLCWDNDFPANGRDFFRKHNDRVRGLGKGRRFLEWDAKDGWTSLCGFLGTPVPDCPFPRADDWVDYKKLVSAQPQS